MSGVEAARVCARMSVYICVPVSHVPSPYSNFCLSGMKVGMEIDSG